MHSRSDDALPGGPNDGSRGNSAIDGGPRDSKRFGIVGLTAIVLCALGLASATGGAWLTYLGGTIYYLLSGALLFAVGVCLWRRQLVSLPLYALYLSGTVFWAFAEVGFDPWALLPRLAVPITLGLWLCMPAISRPLQSSSAKVQRWQVVSLPPLLLVMISGGLLLHRSQLIQDDPILQAGVQTVFPDRVPVAIAPGEDPGNWHSYGRDTQNTRFSPLDQLNPGTVEKLTVAWTFRAGLPPKGILASIEATPLKIGDLIYICTGYNDVIALDAETGQQRWRFTANTPASIPLQQCRGVSYYRASAPGIECAARIITATVDARLIALDARTGEPCRNFGTNGTVSLLQGLGPKALGELVPTSPPVIVGDHIVLGSKVIDNVYWGAPSGVIRGFDAVTGKFAWAFDVGRLDRRTEPPAGETYTPSTPNSWVPLSADAELGLVYVALANPAGADMYGGMRRPFDDAFGSSVVALEVKTGALRWKYQMIHHDLWDYDLASPPTLVDIPFAGGTRLALVQPTKRGEIFILDRTTGKPIFDVIERAVRTGSPAPGDRLSPTQPFSPNLPSLQGRDLTESDMWGITPLDQLWCRIAFRSVRYEGIFTPPGLTPSLEYPGYAGGTSWGGASVDLDHMVLYVNANHLPLQTRLITRQQAKSLKIDIAKGELGLYLPQGNTPYAVEQRPFLSPLGVPCNQPPYNTYAAIDLRTGKLLWSRPLGTARDSGPFGIPSMLPLEMGPPSQGGAIVTRGGLMFVAATQERAIRALHSRTGQELWKARLPAGGQATPATYWSQKSKRQFVVIAASGNLGLQTRTGDYLVAYALPQAKQ